MTSGSCSPTSCSTSPPFSSVSTFIRCLTGPSESLALLQLGPRCRRLTPRSCARNQAQPEKDPPDLEEPLAGQQGRGPADDTAGRRSLLCSGLDSSARILIERAHHCRVRSPPTHHNRVSPFSVLRPCTSVFLRLYTLSTINSAVATSPNRIMREVHFLCGGFARAMQSILRFRPRVP